MLIIDTEDMLRSVEKLVSAGTLGKVQRSAAAGAGSARKHVLVVDDFLTVRELERKLLDAERLRRRNHGPRHGWLERRLARAVST